MENAKGNKYIVIGGKIIDFRLPRVMAIVNVSPDSFYQTGVLRSDNELVERVGAALNNGADIIDVGGCSTRPGGLPVDGSVERERVCSALSLIRREFGDEVVVSLDSFRGNVLRECVEKYNVNIANDVSGFALDASMLGAVVDLQIPYVLMHANAQMHAPVCYDDVTSDVLQYFAAKIYALRQAGFSKEIIIDPGFGFSKSAEQSFELLNNLNVFECFNSPLLVGVSRKSMIYNSLGTTPSEALNGTTVLNSFALERGANILRVHDVKEAKEAIELFKLLKKSEL